eukprot:PhM_4_TR9562/c0_g1_i1/m.26158
METFATPQGIADAAARYIRETHSADAARAIASHASDPYADPEWWSLHRYILDNCDIPDVLMRTARCVLHTVVFAPLTALSLADKFDIVPVLTRVAKEKGSVEKKIPRGTTSVLLRTAVCILINQWRSLPHIYPDKSRVDILAGFLNEVADTHESLGAQIVVAHFIHDTVSEINAAIAGLNSPVFPNSRLCAASFRLAIHRTCLATLYPDLCLVAMDLLSSSVRGTGEDRPSDELLILVMQSLAACFALDPPLVILHPDKLRAPTPSNNSDDEEDATANETAKLYGEWEPQITRALSVAEHVLRYDDNIGTVIAALNMLEEMCKPAARLQHDMSIKVGFRIVELTSGLFSRLRSLGPDSTDWVSDVFPPLSEVLLSLQRTFNIFDIFIQSPPSGLEWFAAVLEMTTFITRVLFGSDAHVSALEFWVSVRQYVAYRIKARGGCNSNSDSRAAEVEDLFSAIIPRSASIVVDTTLSYLVFYLSDDDGDNDDALDIQGIHELVEVLAPILDEEMESFGPRVLDIARMAFKRYCGNTGAGDESATITDPARALGRAIVALTNIVCIADVNYPMPAEVIADGLELASTICNDTFMELEDMENIGGLSLHNSNGMGSNDDRKFNNTMNKKSRASFTFLMRALLHFWFRTRELFVSFQPHELMAVMEKRGTTDMATLCGNVLHFVLTVLQRSPLHEPVALEACNALQSFLAVADLSQLTESGAYLQRNVLEGSLSRVFTNPSDVHIFPISMVKSAMNVRRKYYTTFLCLLSRSRFTPTVFRDLIRKLFSGMMEVYIAIFETPSSQSTQTPKIIANLLSLIADLVGIAEGPINEDVYLLVVEHILTMSDVILTIPGAVTSMPTAGHGRVLLTWCAKLCAAITDKQQEARTAFTTATSSGDPTPYKLCVFVAQLLKCVLMETRNVFGESLPAMRDVMPRIGALSLRTVQNLVSGGWVNLAAMRAMNDGRVPEVFGLALQMLSSYVQHDDLVAHKKLLTEIHVTIRCYLQTLKVGASKNAKMNFFFITGDLTLWTALLEFVLMTVERMATTTLPTVVEECVLASIEQICSLHPVTRELKNTSMTFYNASRSFITAAFAGLVRTLAGIPNDAATRRRGFVVRVAAVIWELTQVLEPLYDHDNFNEVPVPRISATQYDLSVLVPMHVERFVLNNALNLNNNNNNNGGGENTATELENIGTIVRILSTKSIVVDRFETVREIQSALK